MNQAMRPDFQDLMRHIGQLTREGRLQEATQALQRRLGIGASPASHPFSTKRRAADDRVLDGLVSEVDPLRASHVGASPHDSVTASAAVSPPVSRFETGSFQHGGRTLAYKVFEPPQPASGLRPVVLMLHGCTQNPDDFAAGTGMNRLAQDLGFIVIYPAQAQDANPQRCWNWFKPNHQERGRGEPALLAALTEQVVRTHGGDPDRVFVAGLSAGGAMAAVLAQAYPDVFAAAGVHSGLARGTATDAMGALQAMQSGAGPGGARKASAGRPAPTIVFHGDRDSTVHPSHGSHVLAASLTAGAKQPAVRKGASTHGVGFTQQVHTDAAGRVQAEYWVVHGAGHAWSGGNAAGSYTDPRGPDASKEMMRFFLEHGRRGTKP
jgi:poly(hydroxyalkanoate) depolymerase family esterase